MELSLLQKAHSHRWFGLRERFEWDSTSVKGCPSLQADIGYFERDYLTSLLRPVFPIGTLKIVRIENAYLWGRYVLQYEEMRAETLTGHVREQIMIHGTSSTNAYSIARENFDWRLVNRSRFGKGVSFTSDAEYAKIHATQTDVYIVAGVLVANSSRGQWGQIIPDRGEDTTTGFTKDTCIKYYDNDFYPYYIIEQNR